jgi:DNA invertase Pin-like site-specific DNA recombinase
VLQITFAVDYAGNQSTAAQVEKLQTAGCQHIYKENASGGRWDRPELHKLLGRLGKGDVLLVWQLDRLATRLRRRRASFCDPIFNPRRPCQAPLAGAF